MATSAGSRTDPHQELLLDTRAEGRLIELQFEALRYIVLDGTDHKDHDEAVP